MLETIREFGLDALKATGEEAEALDAHARYFLALAEQAEPHLTGKNQQAWLDQLDVEQANLRAALAHLEATGDIEAALRMGKSLGRFWIVRGHLGEGYRRLSRLIEQSRTLPPTSSWIAARNTAGIMAQEAGDIDTAIRLLNEVIAACRERGDTGGLATALSHLGFTYIEMGNGAKAWLLCEEALSLQRELGDLRGEAVALQNLGVLGTLEGSFVEAEAFLLQGRELRRRHGEQRGHAFCYHWLSFNSYWWGRPHEARAYATEGLRHIGSLDDAQVEAVLHVDEGFALMDLEHTADAEAAFAKATPLWERSGNPSGLAFAEMGQAMTRALGGDVSTGRALMEQAMHRLRPTQWQWGVGYGLNLQAEILSMTGNQEASRELFTESIALNRRINRCTHFRFTR